MVKGVQMSGLYVADFETSVRFYRDVLGIPLKIDAHGDYHHAEYSFPDPYFHFALFPIVKKTQGGLALISLQSTTAERALSVRLVQARSSWNHRKKYPIPAAASRRKWLILTVIAWNCSSP